MTIVAMAALGIGAGIVGLVAGLRGPRPSLAAILGRLSTEPRAGRRNSAAGTMTAWRLDRRIGTRLADEVHYRGRVELRFGTAFAITNTSLQDVSSQAILGATAGFVLPAVSWALMVQGGVHVAFAAPLWLGVLFGCAGASLPFVALQAEAKRKRYAARTVISSFLDLVVLGLAGGMGIDGALFTAAQLGEHEFSRRIAGTLTRARDVGSTPWDALYQLGKRTGVQELCELGAAAGLAGTQGARIRATLAARAASIRRHELSDAEAAANEVTERLFLPGVLLLLGFLLFVGYPAFARITSGI